MPTLPAYFRLILWLIIFLPLTSGAQSLLDRYEVHRNLEENSLYSGLLWARPGPDFMGGRIESIEVNPDHPAEIYVGFGSGGLWKTTNYGLSWTPIFSHEASFAMGDLAISPAQPNILWLGTGEQLRASRGYTYSGSGIYRSEDGGMTWVHKGLDQSHQIGRIVTDPLDPNRAFVAVIGHFWEKTTQRGVYYTEDGGDTWENILFVSDSVGVVDLAWDANNQTLYACSWEMPQGAGSAVYQSEDLGQTWRKLDLPFDQPEQTGRLGITLSMGWPNILYVIRDNRAPISAENSELTGAEVYRSDDFGLSWKKTHQDPMGNYSGFGWAFGDIIVHPVHPDEVFIGGVHLLRSTDAGETFSRIGGEIHQLNPNPSVSLHLDQHELKILPSSPGKPDTWVLGNDGGLFISWDQGANWLHYNNMPAGEFYDIHVTDERLPIVTGGTQDNSNIIGRLNPYDFDGPWTEWEYVWLDPWSGGDGFTSIPDPENPDWVYWESQNGHLNKKNMKTGQNVFIKPSPDPDESPLRNSWFTPYFISPFDHGTLYYGANKIYKSINKGDSWERASHDLTFSDFPERKSRSITRMATSGIKPGILYAGTEKGAVWVSRNDGISWHEISAGLPVKKIVDIQPSSHKLSRVFLVAKAMDEIDPTPYVYVSENFGNDWISLSENLPRIPANCILEDPKLEQVIVIGTDAGILISSDRGNQWSALSNQLPTASYVELRWMSDHEFLLAATHGQGLFYCHYQPVQKFIQSGFVGEGQFLGSIRGRLPRLKDYSNDWDTNSIEPLVINWFSPEAGSVRIRLLDGKQEVFTTWVTARQGINQFIWNLVISKEEDKSIYPLPKTEFPKAGNYMLEIELPGSRISGEATILEPGSH